MSSESDDKSAKPKRRVRYRGTHPKKFSEKYKELNPESYPDDIQKIIHAGRTPAGTHLPICVAEILEILKPAKGMTVLDATLGYGGHAVEILKKIVPGGKLFGFDVDEVELFKTEKRLRAQGFTPDVFEPVNLNFAEAVKFLDSVKVDLVLADLGISSMQLDNPERGFSYKKTGPLDLRMTGSLKISAAHYLKTVKEAALKAALKENADEIFAGEIAQAIVESRKLGPIDTTEKLTRIVRGVLKSQTSRTQREQGDRPVRRVFQALRIEVNREFEILDLFLANLPHVLAKKGRVAILTFHSGEDRRVKKAFKTGLAAKVYSDIASEIIRPSASEIYANPRASSAKLRWAIRA